MNERKKNPNPNAITVRNLFTTAWSKLSGAKAPIWSIAITFVFLSGMIEFLTKKYLSVENQTLLFMLRYLILPVLTNLCIAPFYAGSFMVAVDRVRGHPTPLLSGYRYFHYYLPVAVCLVLIGLLSDLLVITINVPIIATWLGAALPYLEIVAGLYSLTVYALFLFAIPLVIDKKCSVGKALTASALRAKPQLPKIVLLFLIVYLCIFLATVPTLIALNLEKLVFLKLLGTLFFIGVLVWTLPFFFLLCAELYRTVILLPSSICTSPKR